VTKGRRPGVLFGMVRGALGRAPNGGGTLSDTDLCGLAGARYAGKYTGNANISATSWQPHPPTTATRGPVGTRRPLGMEVTAAQRQARTGVHTACPPTDVATDAGRPAVIA
jgi:hypothetical protein